MADNLFDMMVFVRVVEAGSLSGAARNLHLSLAVVSRKLARLEERLGVRLVNRTTRTLALTEEGASFHARCVRILAEIDEAEMEVTRGQQTATGLLRVTSTVAFGRRTLAPLLREFQALHPGLQIYLDASDTVVNIIDGGYDLAIRFGRLSDSSLIARQLAPNIRVICGSPDYLDRRGRPQAIEELLTHDCIVFGDPPLDRWSFADGQTVHVRGPLASNDGELGHTWALQGAGLVLKSFWDVQADVEAGRLEIVLPEHSLPAAPIHAIYPHSRHTAAKVRLCVQFLAKRLKEEARLPASVSLVD
jgi:DNA-binding transcriptional LysR family regulator